ncbi:hypothetical protein, partial [Actinoalloteichus caeruleus]|uniref:hypothetical protein n=1 Tax=Actinoalloteichus cyanogriseus TaxID=2893586 RepID=UPI000558413D
PLLRTRTPLTTGPTTVLTAALIRGVPTTTPLTLVTAPPLTTGTLITLTRPLTRTTPGTLRRRIVLPPPSTLLATTLTPLT